jgi:hypothetical protein
MHNYLKSFKLAIDVTQMKFNGRQHRATLPYWSSHPLARALILQKLPESLRYLSKTLVENRERVPWTRFREAIVCAHGELKEEKCIRFPRFSSDTIYSSSSSSSFSSSSSSSSSSYRHRRRDVDDSSSCVSSSSSSSSSSSYRHRRRDRDYSPSCFPSSSSSSSSSSSRRLRNRNTRTNYSSSSRRINIRGLPKHAALVSSIMKRRRREKR